MGKIKVINNVTLDGVMQAPARADEDTREGFTFGGWGIPYQDAAIGKKLGEMMMNSEGALLFGRRTYEDLFSFWPKQTNNPYTEHLNKARKYVVSTTLTEPLTWQNSNLINGDVINKIKAIKQNTNLTILGSGDLIKSLMRENLIDEFVLLTFPIILGAGRRLFTADADIKLNLLDSVISPSGVIIATYCKA